MKFYLDIFEYFNGIDLLRTFYGLNLRFNYILHARFPDCSFKFNSVSKHDFDRICQRYLPTMAHYINILNLFDTEETPTQIKLFTSYMPVAYPGGGQMGNCPLLQNLLPTIFLT